MISEFRFYYPIRVRYHEIDGQKIVYNATYLTYMDIALTEYYRNLGIDVWTGEDFDFALVKSTIEYKKSARLDDVLSVYVRTAKLGNKSFTVQFETVREGSDDLICTVETIYVSYRAETGESVGIPDGVRKRIQDFEDLGASN